MPNKLKTPILFIIFNRPETTRVVFEAIRQAKPPKLFIAADGPRENKIGEKEKCDEVRKIVDKVDWECEVKTLFREKNLGCGKAPSEAITWFFENVEEGIILEDDCLPNLSFFRFCEELLEKYRSNEKIFMISGDNFLPKFLMTEDEYYLSRMTHIWGWATWRRAWKKYDFEMNDFPNFVKDKVIDKIWQDKKARKFWLEKLSEIKKDHFDLWDYQWTYCMWKNDSYSIAPNVNLISNIGFGGKATHTLNKNDPFANLPSEEIKLPLTTENPKLNVACDNYENERLYPKNFNFKIILKKIGLFKIVRMLYLKINQ
jgi:hypothetical protein